MSKPTSLSIVTIPFIKKSVIAKRELAQWHWKGIWVYLRVMSIFPVTRLTTYYTKSVIYTMSLDVIGEATITVAELNGVKVH